MSKYKTTALNLKKMLEDFPLPKSDIYELREHYKDYSATYDKTQRQFYIGVAARLLEDMAFNGATEDEIKNAIIFSIVALDADKYRLNILEAYKELGIKDLEAAYAVCN